MTIITRVWVVTALLLPTSELSAWQGQFKETINKKQSNTRLSLHPFTSESSRTSFGLLKIGKGDFKSSVHSLLKERFLHPMVQLKSQSSGSRFSFYDGARSVDISFSVSDIPVCSMQVRAHLLKDGTSMILGQVPEISPYEPAPELGPEGAIGWPDLQGSFDKIIDLTEEDPAFANTKLAKAEKCFFVSEGTLLPVWKINLTANGLPYMAIGDDHETLSVSKSFFSASGTARVYEFNETDASGLQNIPLVNLLEGQAYLETPWLKTLPKNAARAEAQDFKFIFSPTDIRFDEVSSFTHAQMHLVFVEKIGFEWYGPKPLIIRTHERPNNATNNALFIPADGAGVDFPTIYLGDGDGETLQNLPRDSDVVSHELGHHVVYQNLKETDGESLVLHEGLADFFAFSRTGDACLGESICPEKSSACRVKGKCLRSGETDLSFKSSEWNSLSGQGHLQGQIVSGMLWDLRKTQVMTPAQLTKLVLKAVSFLVKDSGLRDFMLALFLADKELYESQYHDNIKSAGDSRNLKSLYTDVTLAEIPLPEGKQSNLSGGNSGPQPSTTTRKKSEKTFTCGTIAKVGYGSQIPLLLLILLPILAVRYRPQAVRSSVRTRSKR